MIKLNCDAAFSFNGEKHEIEFIARDSYGNFVVAGSKTLWLVVSAEHVEAQTMFWVLSVALDHD